MTRRIQVEMIIHLRLLVQVEKKISKPTQTGF